MRINKQYIYRDASAHADKICEHTYSSIREALMEAYVKGFVNGMKFQEKNTDTENGTNEGKTD